MPDRIRLHNKFIDFDVVRHTSPAVKRLSNVDKIQSFLDEKVKYLRWVQFYYYITIKLNKIIYTFFEELELTFSAHHQFISAVGRRAVEFRSP